MKVITRNTWKSSLGSYSWKFAKNFKSYHTKRDLSSENSLESHKAKTAIGVSEFIKLVMGSTVFVDKTLLIKEFVEDPGETLLMTFPRRWGKTINLDMIRTFFNVETDENGNQLPLTKYSSHQIFKGGEIDLGFGNIKKLNPLKIAHDEAFMKRQGQYPVIHIDFKNTKGRTYEEVFNKVKAELRKTYSNHEYLIKSPHLRGDEHGIFSKYLHFTDYQKLTTDEVSQGLYILSSLLQKHFGRKSFILVDEYDAAINYAHMGSGSKDAGLITDFFRDMNETTFKSNKHLEKGLITGVFRIAKANLFSGLNNLAEYNILDSRFSPYYGFTQQEVEYLLAQYQVPESLAQDIKSWYNGYILRGHQIYNPWSIVKCLSKFQENRTIEEYSRLKTKILQNYWEESGNIDFIKPLLKLPIVKSKIDQLLKGMPLFFNLKKQISSGDYEILKQVTALGSNYTIDESVADLLFSYLFAAGYLTGDEVNGFKLPNNEVMLDFQHKMLEHYRQQYHIDTRLFTDVTDQLQKVLDAKDQVESEQAIESLKISLERLLSEFPEFTQIKEGNLTGSGLTKIVHANEDLIHSVMSYITLQLKSLSKFGTEVYLGGGRADIVFIDEENNKAAVIELKYGKETAQNAIEQIKEKEYAKKFIETWDTILIGISVSGKKEINIAYEEIFKDKNFSGEGTSKDDNSYDLPYNEWFNKYYSEGIEKILQLRINELKPDLKEKISVLPARYQLKSGNTDIKKLIETVNQLDITENSLVLIPYNIGNKHWVGFILRKTDSFEVVYIDPENNPIDSALLLDLEQSLGIEKHDFQQKLVVTQKYNNCGSELIENFIYHLTGNRIEESEAVMHHSYLMENELMAECSETLVLGEV